jgi:hypothetical protein
LGRRLTLPASHVVQVMAPSTSENLPTAHGRQSLALTEPSSELLVPGTQSSHAEPAASPYLPASQSRQSAAATEPALVVDVPATQSTHCEPSSLLLHLPTGHVSQPLPFESRPDPAGHCSLDVHPVWSSLLKESTHSLQDVCPGASVNVDPVQGVHTGAPVAFSQNVPGAH